MTFPETIHFIISEAVRFFSPIGLAMQWAIAFVTAFLILLFPRLLTRPLAIVAEAFRSFSARPRMALLLCVALPVVLRLLLLPIDPVPAPSIHDEFSHLLLADTLAHGRLTNPTPAMWRHFESIHVIQTPTYNSMYPPAQGLFLAAGQIVTGAPWAGVELAIALMCGAMYWMFVAWLPRPWALFGVFLVVIKLALVGFWVDSYMGGSVPALGGALVMGAFPRLQRANPRTVHAVLFGLGAVLLMNSRPFEGGVLTATLVALLIPSLLRKFKIAPTVVFKRMLLPAACVLGVGILGLGYYCWRVTGNPARLPYQVNRATYGWPENLAFLSQRNVTLPDPVLQRMHDLEAAHHDIYKTGPALTDNLVTRVFDNWAYLIGPVLTIPLLVSFFLPSYKASPLIIVVLAIGALNLFQMLLYPYHLAPIVPALYCLVALGCQRIAAGLTLLFGRERALGFALLLPLSLLSIASIQEFGDELDIPPSSYWERGYEWHRDARAAIVKWLNLRKGRQLVLVRYSHDHPVNQEWVYNGADLDGARIIWAREALDEAFNRELLNFYSSRQAWLLQADVYPQRVVPYPISVEGATHQECFPCKYGATRR